MEDRIINNPLLCKLITQYSTGDLDTSELFIKVVNHKLLFLADRNEWRYYNGKNWEKDIKARDQAMRQFTDEAIKALYSTESLNEDTRKMLIQYYSRLAANKTLRDRIIKDAEAVDPCKSKIFDTYKFLFNCQNGTYNFETNQLQEHNRDDFLTDISNVIYNPKAQAPRFVKYLDEITKEDRNIQHYLSKIGGYCLTGDTSKECFFVFYGDKTRNGKGTFVSTLMYLLGDYAKTLPAESITKKNINAGGGGASPDIARLKGARLASVNEFERNSALNVALVKSFTGGDTQTARELYKENFDFVPQFKILINTNFLPTMSDDSIFKSDRLHLVEFTQHFDENNRDEHLKEKLQTEISGIFNLFVMGYRELQESGWEVPEASKMLVQEYELKSNNVKQFASENLIEKKGSYIKRSEVYQKYTEFCETSGYKALGRNNFYMEMGHLGYIYKFDNFLIPRINFLGEEEKKWEKIECYLNVAKKV